MFFGWLSLWYCRFTKDFLPGKSSRYSLSVVLGVCKKTSRTSGNGKFLCCFCTAADTDSDTVGLSRWGGARKVPGLTIS